MSGDTYDAVVIGGGPGGYAAAIRLAQLGQRALLVEQDALGGACLNWGCIPTKTLLTSTRLVDRLRRAGPLGVTGTVRVDLPQLQAHREDVVLHLRRGIEHLLLANGVTTWQGRARCLHPDTVEVTTAEGEVRRCAARKGVVIATGARPATLTGFEPNGTKVLTAREALGLTTVPPRLLVVGGGIIGVELGTLFQQLGSRVTIVEAQASLLPAFDREAVGPLERRFRAGGGEILTRATPTRHEPGAPGLRSRSTCRARSAGWRSTPSCWRSASRRTAGASAWNRAGSRSTRGVT